VCSRRRVALRFDPLGHVGDGELQVLAEAICAGTDAARAPVVDRRDGHAKIFRQLADIEQWRQVGRRQRKRAWAGHTDQVRDVLPGHRNHPQATLANRAKRRSDGVSLGVLNGRIRFHQRKISETPEFPRFFGRADSVLFQDIGNIPIFPSHPGDRPFPQTACACPG